MEKAEAVEYRAELSADEFALRYKNKRPVITPMAKHWKAVENWGNIGHLLQHLPGPHSVLVANDNRRFIDNEIVCEKRMVEDAIGYCLHENGFEIDAAKSPLPQDAPLASVTMEKSEKKKMRIIIWNARLLFTLLHFAFLKEAHMITTPNTPSPAFFFFHSTLILRELLFTFFFFFFFHLILLIIFQFQFFPGEWERCSARGACVPPNGASSQSSC
jgi:hypothetical protein